MGFFCPPCLAKCFAHRGHLSFDTEKKGGVALRNVYHDTGSKTFNILTGHLKGFQKPLNNIRIKASQMPSFFILMENNNNEHKGQGSLRYSKPRFSKLSGIGLPSLHREYIILSEKEVNWTSSPAELLTKWAEEAVSRPVPHDPSVKY